MDKYEEAGKTGGLFEAPLLSLFPRLPLSLSLNRLSTQQNVLPRGFGRDLRSAGLRR